MDFELPRAIFVGVLLSLAAGGLSLLARRARVRRAARWSQDLETRARRAGRWGFLPAACSVFLAALGIAGPRWGQSFVTAESRGLDVVMAVDISRSMLAEDAEPSRLDRARDQATRLLHDLRGSRIGLIAFSGQSFILSPLTADVSALELMLDALHPDMASEGGTELARALRQGAELLLASSGPADRVLVIFTDGEAHDSVSEILEEGARLRREGVRLVLVAQGGDQPVNIPLRGPDGELLGFQEDPAGGLVETRRRDDILRALADEAHAPIVAAALPDQAGAVRDLVSGYRGSVAATTLPRERTPRAWIAALLAAVVLLGHAFTRPTAALWVVALLCVSPSVARGQQPRSAAYSAWVRGDFRSAMEGYLKEARSGAGGDTSWYNAGTAALAVSDTGLALDALRRASRSLDPWLRHMALYNLGLLALRLAEQDSARREQWLEEAIARYREALLLRPGDGNAKWNLELALRRRSRFAAPERPSGSVSGGASAPEEARLSGGGLTLEQALQILEAVSREERSLRRKLARLGPAKESPRGKNW